MSDMRQIENAYTQYAVDNLRSGLTRSSLSSSVGASVPLCNSSYVEIGTAGGNVNLSSFLTSQYIPSIPMDPSSGTAAATGYTFCIESDSTMKTQIRSLYYDTSCVLSSDTSSFLASAGSPTSTPVPTNTPTSTPVPTPTVVGVVQFATGVDFASTDNGSTPVFEDVDGDGKNDVILGGGSGTSHVYRNTSTSGTVSFASGVNLPGVNNTYATPLFVDVDGDGKKDVILAGSIPYGGSGGTSQVFRNTSSSGAISFASGVNLANASSFHTPLFVDVDGDGKNDVILGGDSGTSRVYRNTSTSGTISFATGVNLSAPSNFSSPLFVDVDGDGKNDVILSGTSGTSYVYRNTSTSGTISFATGVNLPGASPQSTPLFVDVDGDGKNDVMLPDIDGIPRVFRNTSTSGTISFATGVNFAGPYMNYTNPLFLDADGDGKNDFILGGNSGTSRVYRNTSTSGTISFATGVSLVGVSYNTSTPLFVDVDGDGKKDVILGGIGGTSSVYRNTSTSGTISFATGVNLSTTENFNSTPLFVDVDGDGKKDVILGGYGGTSRVFRNTSISGAISFTTGISLATPDNQSTPLFVDVDGDGKNDVILGGRSGTSRVYRNTSY
jgi:pyruvate/2-oxoacid:ferredoxin oxidoreductase beta subunit